MYMCGNDMVWLELLCHDLQKPMQPVGIIESSVFGRFHPQLRQRLVPLIVADYDYVEGTAGYQRGWIETRGWRYCKVCLNPKLFVFLSFVTWRDECFDEFSREFRVWR